MPERCKEGTIMSSDVYKALSVDSRNRTGLKFMFLGLLALFASLMAGVLAAFKFLDPEFLSVLEFHQLRPLHVSLAISWIFLICIGGIYFYLPQFNGLKLFSLRMANWHFWLFLLGGVAIIGSYLTGNFGGREYWAFPPVLALPIFVSWTMFGINYFRTVRREKESWPVYYWMWGTGIVFFLFTFTEAYLYLLPFFRDNMVREMTVQWKAYGALIGSWNMLVYGTAIFVMEKICGDCKIAHSKMSFSLYFLSLAALMFGWAHHAYAVPMSEWVRNLAYFVSMAELFILGKIIWDWRSTVSTCMYHKHRQAFRFLFAADIWLFLNLILAICISIPVANLLTHGTHITVAHAMGTTIGINTMILMGSVYFVVEECCPDIFINGLAKSANWGCTLANVGLFVLLGALLTAGVSEGFNDWESHYDKIEAATPYLTLFAVSGIALLIGLWLAIIPALKMIGILAFTSRSQVD